MRVTESRLEEMAAAAARFVATDGREGWAAVREAGEVCAALADDRLEVVGRCTCEAYGVGTCPRCGPELATVAHR